MHLTRVDLALIWGVPSIIVAVVIVKTLRDDRAYTERLRQRALEQADQA